MDVMKIESDFGTSLIAAAVNRILQKQIGPGARVEIGVLDARIGEEFARLHIDLDISMTREQLAGLVKCTGKEKQ